MAVRGLIHLIGQQVEAAFNPTGCGFGHDPTPVRHLGDESGPDELKDTGDVGDAATPTRVFGIQASNEGSKVVPTSLVRGGQFHVNTVPFLIDHSWKVFVSEQLSSFCNAERMKRIWNSNPTRAM